MNSIWLSLLWKEWRRQRWKLAALTVIILSAPTIIISILIGQGEAEHAESILGITANILYPYALLAGMFVGMSVAAGENSRRTSRFLGSLPTSPWKSASAKVCVAMLVLALPVVLLMACVWFFTSLQPLDSTQLAIRHSAHEFHLPWGIENVFVARAVGGVLGVWSVFLWTITGGVNRADEIRAGALAFLYGALAWLGFAGIHAATNEVAVRGYPTEWLGYIGLLMIPVLPGGPGLINSFLVESAEYRGMSWIALALSALISHSLLLFWFLTRAGPVPARVKYDLTGDWELIPPRRVTSLPLRSHIDAIIWKQVREIAPLVVVAILGIVTLAPLLYWFDRLGRGVNRFGDILGSLTMAVAALVALVTGIGLLYEDYAKGVESFWRSRPLNVHAWFWVKFVTGLILLMVSFLPILAFSYWLLGWSDDTLVTGWLLAMIYMLLYSCALAWYSILRQPIYAAILAIGSLFAGWLALVWTWPGGPPPWLRSFFGYPLATLVLAMLTSLLAWQAVVRDWGWKRGR